MAKKPRKSPCGACRANRLRVAPEYASCKKKRLCDIVDPGLLLFHGAYSLDAYREAQDMLLRGVRALEAKQQEPLPESENDFVRAVRDAHRSLFIHVLPKIAGEFRSEMDDVTFGGDGRNKREGFPHDEVEAGVRASFRLARQAAGTPARKCAAFLEMFFRVHPFLDGNGRIGRFFVQKIGRANGKVIRQWASSGRSRRRYVTALEYAHHWHHQGVDGLTYLERWISRQMEDADDGD